MNSQPRSEISEKVSNNSDSSITNNISDTMIASLSANSYGVSEVENIDPSRKRKYADSIRRTSYICEGGDKNSSSGGGNEACEQIPKKQAFSQIAERLSDDLRTTTCSVQKNLCQDVHILSPEHYPDDMSPDSYLELIMKAQLGFAPTTKPALSISTDFFPVPTEENLASYTTESLLAIRDGDMKAIKELHDGGHCFRSCNRFGESIIHTACRRGFTEIVRFLIDDADVSIRVRDDYGRTPLHDACWNRLPKFDLIDMLIKKEPCLLLVTDKRGSTPFEYARREDWAGWRQFLYERREYLCLNSDVTKIFGGPNEASGSI